VIGDGRAAPTQEKGKAMNEFEGILTVVVFFAVRIGLPALVIYGLARLARRVFGVEPDEDEESIQERPAH